MALNLSNFVTVNCQQFFWIFGVVLITLAVICSEAQKFWVAVLVLVQRVLVVGLLEIDVSTDPNDSDWLQV